GKADRSPSAPLHKAASASFSPPTRSGVHMKGIESAAVLQTKVQIEGMCSDRFAPVREAFAHNLETGQDIRASVAVFVDGGGRPVGRLCRWNLHPRVRSSHDCAGLLIHEN